jgi:alcohol sulfotransferase
MLRDLLAPGLKTLKAARHHRFMRDAAPSVDALIASFPKCGRTWLRYVLSSYFATSLHLGPPPDLHSMFRIIPNFDAERTRGLPAFAFASARPHLPLICVTHAPARLTPNLPVIFLVRDPRDVIVSRYFHSTRHKHEFSGTIAKFIDDPEHGLPAYIRYLNSWTAFLAGTRHHVTSYELMSADISAEVRKVLHFLGVAIDEGALGDAVARSAFDAMRRTEKVQGIPAHDYDRGDDESLRMRRGVAHGFRGYLTDELIEKIDRRCATDLSGDALALLRDYSFGSAGGAPVESTGEAWLSYAN